MSVNKVFLMGLLDNAPELKYTSDGRPYALFTLVTNERYVDQQGQQREATMWHKIIAWRKMALRCEKILTKGSRVFVEGKISTSTWQDQDGITRSKSDVKIDQMRLLWSPEPEAI
ncbi:MAG: single-stranded DNA-binding protein, partial [Anaerolineales bacterium]